MIQIDIPIFDGNYLEDLKVILCKKKYNNSGVIDIS